MAPREGGVAGLRLGAAAGGGLRALPLCMGRGEARGQSRTTCRFGCGRTRSRGGLGNPLVCGEVIASGLEVLRCCGREVVSGALLVAAPRCRGMLSALGSRCHRLHAAPPDGAALASAIPAPHSVLPSARVWNYHFSLVAFQPKGVEFILSHSFLCLPKTTTVFLVRAFSC